MSSDLFSIRQRRRSFTVACQGLARFFREEPHAWIHLSATVVVIVFANLLHVSFIEAAWLALATGLVWMAELLNTSVEKLTDFVTLERKPQLKYVKDLAAAAVLVAALTACVIGGTILIPKLF